MAAFRPALAHPELGAVVATRVDELPVVAVGHEAIGDLERFQPHLVSGRFVVEVKAGSRMPHLHKAACAGQPGGADVIRAD